jgi:hypothetical protein
MVKSILVLYVDVHMSVFIWRSKLEYHTTCKQQICNFFFFLPGQQICNDCTLEGTFNIFCTSTGHRDFFIY